MTLVAHPVDWSITDVPAPFFCPRCWSDFADDVIDGEILLRTIEHPLRRCTFWACPRCTLQIFDTEPLRPEAERHAALLDVRAHLALWSLRQGLRTEEDYRKEMARDEF